MKHMTNGGQGAGQWLARLEAMDGPSKAYLAEIYGPGEALSAPRVALMRTVLQAHLKRYGDVPVRLFRSPGRINLRGMHVDTHGGYLNLMTHQREVVLAASKAANSRWHAINIDPEFDEVSFDLSRDFDPELLRRPWMDLIRDSALSRQKELLKGHWSNYLRGAALRAWHEAPGSPPPGHDLTVGSDLPRGAALSSSHALCIVTLLAALAEQGLRLSPDALILAVRDAEWFTGARTGTSDQAAEILGGRGEVVNTALLAEDFDSSGARRFLLPDSLRVLVINSYTRRNLSGAQLAAFTRNRFAYSMALEILRQELQKAGHDPVRTARLDRLSRINPEALGGVQALYSALRRIPEELTLEELQTRYRLPELSEQYQQYFGDVSEAERPKTFGLRGPLLFGIAESDRARHFLPALEAGDYHRAGRLMSLGHDGDRIVDGAGKPFQHDYSDDALERMAQKKIPIEECPGEYRASSPVLDALVDTAIEAGALGASLTGGGIAGSVLALCRTEDAGHLAEVLRKRLAADDYPALARRTAPLTEDELAQAVLVNAAPAGAGELHSSFQIV